ncbi:MAG: hypothetical protein JRF63_03965 [Deltaproteobacteria bacterium]|nr:hypothetical protein [Deltaproteobacteria bacterium]
MIYCPHCRRPSARNSGACPHCGKSLTGSDAPGPPESAAAGAEYDLDDDGSGGDIELAGDDYMAPQTAAVQGIPGLAGDADLGPAPRDESSLSLVDVTQPPPTTKAETSKPIVRGVDDDELRGVAGFGSPRPGPIGAIRYGLHVSTRLKELATELDRAAESEHTATDRLRASRANLGRKASQAGQAGDELEAMVSRALRADAELTGAEDRRAGIESQQQGKTAEIEQGIARLETESAPIVQQEAEASKRLDALRTDRKRVEAKLKRAEIERRNLSELVEKRQQAYADLEKPKEERQKLLADITRFESDLKPINQRIEAARDELQTFEKPVADAEGALTAIRGQVSEKLAQISALRDEAGQLGREFGTAVGDAAVFVQEESKRADDAWAAIGEQVFQTAAVAKGSPLSGEREGVAAALERFDDTKRQVDLLTRARDSYDHQTVKQAKQFAFIGGAVLIGLILLSIFLIAS